MANTNQAVKSKHNNNEIVIRDVRKLSGYVKQTTSNYARLKLGSFCDDVKKGLRSYGIENDTVDTVPVSVGMPSIGMNCNNISYQIQQVLLYDSACYPTPPNMQSRINVVVGVPRLLHKAITTALDTAWMTLSADTLASTEFLEYLRINNGNTCLLDTFINYNTLIRNACTYPKLDTNAGPYYQASVAPLQSTNAGKYPKLKKLMNDKFYMAIKDYIEVLEAYAHEMYNLLAIRTAFESELTYSKSYEQSEAIWEDTREKLQSCMNRIYVLIREIWEEHPELR